MLKYDEERFDRWVNCCSDIKHNKQDISYELVKQVYEQLNKKYGFLQILSCLRIHYWKNFDNVEEFEDDIKKRIENNGLLENIAMY